MADHITADQLRPADVILCRGTGLLSQVIILMDGSDYSHCAIHLPPEGNSHFVGEEVDAGVVKDTLESLIAGHTRVTARRILDTSLDLSPVLSVAAGYLAEGDRYAYEQLILLAPLCLSRKIPLPWVVKRLVRSVLDHASEFLEQLASAGRHPMICSEFVYRCYGEADPANPNAYDLEIDSTPSSALTTTLAVSRPPRGRGIHPNSVLAAVLRAWPLMTASPVTAVPRATPVENLDQAAQDYLDAVEAHVESVSRADLVVDESVVRSVQRFAVSLAKAHPSAVQTAALEHLTQTVADFVTPGDLDRTQSLKDVGDLQSVR